MHHLLDSIFFIFLILFRDTLSSRLRWKNDVQEQFTNRKTLRELKAFEANYVLMTKD